MQALTQEAQISFYFKEYEREERKVQLSLFGLKQFDSRWYAVGRNHLSENNHELNRFDLDRCHTVCILDKKIKKTDEDHHFKINDFFTGAYGVIRGIEENKEVEEIVLKAEYRQSCYLKSTPLHHSQTWEDIEEDETKDTLFTLKISPTYDFKMKILSMGTRIEVLKPTHLRYEIIALFKEVLKMYDHNI